MPVGAIKALKETGDSGSTVDGYGKTPMDLAVENAYFDIYDQSISGSGG
jgi:hypothetical protein